MFRDAISIGVFFFKQKFVKSWNIRYRAVQKSTQRRVLVQSMDRHCWADLAIIDNLRQPGVLQSGGAILPHQQSTMRLWVSI